MVSPWLLPRILPPQISRFALKPNHFYSVAAAGGRKKNFGFVKNRSPPFPRVVCGMGTRFYSSPNPQNGPESEHLRPQSCPRQGRGGGVEVVRFESKSGDLRRQDSRQQPWGDHRCTHLIRRLRGRRGQTKYKVGLSRRCQNHACSCTLQDRDGRSGRLGTLGHREPLVWHLDDTVIPRSDGTLQGARAISLGCCGSISCPCSMAAPPHSVPLACWPRASGACARSEPLSVCLS